MGSNWQNLYLPGLVNAAFTLSLKKQNYPFIGLSTLKIIGEVETGVDGGRLASGLLERWPGKVSESETSLGLAQTVHPLAANCTDLINDPSLSRRHAWLPLPSQVLPRTPVQAQRASCSCPAALSTGPYLTSSLLSPQLKPDTLSPVESSRNRLEVQGPPSSTLAASNKLERWKQAGLAGFLGPK